jgi:hypothetical protein
VVFTKRLREGVRRGRITCSVRIWQYPHVTVGTRYRMDEGAIEVDSIVPISFADITPDLARESGFEGVIDLLKIAKHGPGENVYLIRFHYVPPGSRLRVRRKPVRRRAQPGPEV